MKKFITLSRGLLNVERIAYIQRSKENPGGVRLSLGAQFLEFEKADADTIVAALSDNGVDISSLVET